MWNNVRIVGRAYLHQGVLWCGLSGSGVAFCTQAKEIVITFKGDDTTAGVRTEGNARFAVYANGKRIVDEMMNLPEQKYTVWKRDDYEAVTIQVIKLSECAMSTLGIADIQADVVDGIHPLPEKELKLEFIGDSITCGFGVDREDPDTPFETATEDVTRGYAYKVAQKLDADYSMVSYSGYGLISGYTEDNTKRLDQLVSSYYKKVGFSYAKPEGAIELADIPWDFKKYEPQIIVINLGTNDDSYCQDYKERQLEFQEKYVAFLRMVHENNPQASILCTAGLMGERIYSSVKAAVEQYNRTASGTIVKALRLPVQLPEDGLVSCGHPTEISHEKAAVRISDFIRSEMLSLQS